MGTTAFVFPGQGSQAVGMGADLADHHPGLLRGYYELAARILGRPIADLCWTGPAEELRHTAVTQPAIFLTSQCAARVLAENGVVPGVVAGHSLGEYGAYVAAEILDWSDAMRLVRLRGRLMARENDRAPGRMAAVIGVRLEVLEQICADTEAATGEVVEVANDNEANQVVISGTEFAVDTALPVIEAAGARRLIRLGVGAPFHCRLMAGMAGEFGRALDDVAFHEPVLDVVSSVSADVVQDARQARELLARQLTARVRWRESLLRMNAMGVSEYVEVGHGKTLSAMTRRTFPDARTFTTGDQEQLERVLAETATAKAS